MSTELKDRITEMLKASFGGDRSAAGRYAANIRWQNQKKNDDKYAEQDRLARRWLLAHKTIKAVLYGKPSWRDKITAKHLKLVEEYNNRMTADTDYWSGSRQAKDAARAIDKMKEQLASNDAAKRDEETKDGQGFREVSNEQHKAWLQEANARKKQLAKDGTLTNDEQRSLGLWGTSAHTQINEVLRFPGNDVDERNWVPENFPPEDAANALMSAFEKMASPIEESIVVYRGVAYDDEVSFSESAEPGKKVADRGFVATSINAQEARSYGDGSGVDAFMEIRIPKGTKVLVPQTAYTDQEREVLLPPDTEMRVIEVKSVEDRYGEARVYVLEVMS